MTLQVIWLFLGANLCKYQGVTLWMFAASVAVKVCILSSVEENWSSCNCRTKLINKICWMEKKNPSKKMLKVTLLQGHSVIQCQNVLFLVWVEFFLVCLGVLKCTNTLMFGFPGILGEMIKYIPFGIKSSIHCEDPQLINLDFLYNESIKPYVILYGCLKTISLEKCSGPIFFLHHDWHNILQYFNVIF